MKRNVSFKWSNYAKPTPKNLEFLFELFEDTLKLITGFSVWEQAPVWVPLSILVFSFICGKLKKFFANIAIEGDQEEVKVTFPSTMSESVEVTQQTKEKDE